MWSQIVLCLCVGLAYATSNPAWTENSEYHYHVTGRTFASLHDVSDQHSGILYKADLKIQPISDGNLHARLSNSQYAQILRPLSDGWRSPLPDSELPWRPLEISTEPFQICLENGVVKGLTVSKGISNWEANMLKGIVSQFQLTLVESPESSKENLSPFKVMEDTVTGSTETFYRIVRLPEHIIQQEPQGQKLMMEKKDGDVYEVVKHKNYTNSVELPSYFFGFADLEQGFPATNKAGTFLTRGSFSRAILTGKLNRYTIQNAFTVSEVLVNPTLTDKQQGSVYSMVNATLVSVEPHQEAIHEISNPVHLGNLVYSYGKPFGHNNEAREKSLFDSSEKEQMARYQISKNVISRLRRSLDDIDLLPGSEESYKQAEPELDEAPESPLLRFTAGYKGQSIKRKLDVVQKVKELAKEIATELQDPYKSLEKESLYKFTVLTSLVRVMDVSEMRNVGDELFSADKGENQEVWEIYRDSVAGSGTGPALLSIREWIESKRVEGIQAGLVIATMSRAVRQPSLQYMKTYFDLIKSPKVLSNWPMNDTAILSFSQLVRQVYGNMKHSAAQYPVKSFRNFRNEPGVEFLKAAAIPYFAEQLHRAISDAQTHKIHVYIRALGNTGRPEILSAFEPYLEGKKQASQFQRLLMVLAMDRLAENYPDQALAALVRLYYNSAENEQVRVAAVYQIIRTKPSAAVLQSMASYTHIDKQHHVIAAVKSSIETIHQLEGEEFHELRQAAAASKPLLSKKSYGIQYGGQYFRQKIVDDLRIKYKEVLQFIGSEDQIYPKGMKFSVRFDSAGLRKKIFNVQAMVSSLEELVHVFQRKTARFSEKEEQQKQNHESQMQHSFSSQKIAELLKLQPEEREQLEANLYYENDAAQTMFSFDNKTVNKIIEELTKFESNMQQGKEVRYLKLSNDEEMAIAFPTEMGLPFLYTYDTPSYVKIQGSFQGAATPKVGNEKLLHVPDSIIVEADLSLTMASKVEGRISFITPFDHQQYLSGHKKTWYISIPLKGKFEWDRNREQIRAEFEKEITERPTVLFHYSTGPFVSRLDLLKLEPSSLMYNPDSSFPGSYKRVSFDRKYGEKEAGLALRFKFEQEKPFDLYRLRNIYNEEGLFAALLGLRHGEPIQRSELTVTSLPQEYSTQKCVVTLAHKSSYRSSTQEELLSDNIKSQQSEMDRWQTASPEERQKDVLERVNKQIQNSKSKSIDISVDFHGAKNIKYTMTGAYAKSDVHPKSRVMFMFRKKSDRQADEPYMLAFNAENIIENTNGLDLEHIIQEEPEINSLAQVVFGTNFEELSKIRAQIKFRRSEERKQYLKAQPTYKQCRSEMKDGNKQLSACSNITLSAGLLDRVQAKVQYEHLPLKFREVLKSVYYAVQYKYYPSIEVDTNQKLGKGNELSFQAKFDPDLRAVNVSLKTEDRQLEMKNIPLTDWTKEIFVQHPVFHLRSRLMAKALAIQNYRPFCVVDQTHINTFNNRTYPADISDKWTVMFQYIPKEARFKEHRQSIDDQLKYQLENYAVLVKSNDKSRSVKITLSSPETKFKVVDITMSPRPQEGSKDPLARVTVDEREVQVNENQNYDDKNGFIQIYTLPNGEVKAEIKDQFYVVFDGKRFKLAALNGKFRDSTRGICGPLSDGPFDDFLTPDRCYVQDYHKFIKSYEVEGSQGKEVRHQLKSGKNMECVRKSNPLYAEVVTVANSQSWQKQSVGQCTSFQTQYVKQNGELCFTIRQLPVCRHGCRPVAFNEKNVPVHCVQKSTVADLWKNQIDNGGNPDFSQKSESKTVTMQVPQSCA